MSFKSQGLHSCEQELILDLTNDIKYKFFLILTRVDRENILWIR